MNQCSVPTWSIDGLFGTSVELSSLLDKIPLGMAILDRNRRVRLLNRHLQALTGFTSEEAIGLPCAHILRSNICLGQCPLAKLDGSEALSMEGDIINRDRRKIPVRVTIAPILGERERVVGYVEFLEDLRHLQTPRVEQSRSYGFGNVIGRSGEMERMLQILPIIAQSDSPMLITGESGTGKSLVAETIHKASARAKAPFIKLNCGALPETLLEAELFGFQRGALPGSVESKPGRFRLAHNGTLYLTEIDDLPKSLQVKLLGFLDEQVVCPVGGAKSFHVNVRVIAATRRDPEIMVRKRGFREDLLFRLGAVRLQLPPLRERADDVSLLLDHFLHTFTARMNKPVKGFSAQTLRTLEEYSYPGNVRELMNIVGYALNVCDGELVQPEHLPTYITSRRAKRRAGEPAAATETDATAPKQWDGGALLSGNWSSVEQRMIVDALVKAKGRKGKAAAMLGWSRSTFWRKLKQYGMDEQS